MPPYDTLTDEELIDLLFKYVTVSSPIKPCLQAEAERRNVWEHIEPLLELNDDDIFED